MNFIRTAIARPVTVSMCVVAVVLFGIVSLDRLALNLLPDISYPSLTIQTNYEDAAPEEVESLITRPIEEAVGVLPGLTRISSTSRSGQSEVVLEFAWKTNMDLSALEAREKLDFVPLPRDAARPVILRFDPSHDPIMRLQLSGDMSLSRLRYAAEKELKKGLESTEGVAAIKVIGGLEEQVRIEIDEKRLAQLGIPITEVSRILAQENLNQASGSLYDLDANYLVRMLNQFRSVEEMERIILRDQDGRKIVLGDVATVTRGAKDRDIIARLNGKESVELAIYKEGDANTVTVSRAVQDRIAALKRANLFPKDTQLEIVFNQADFIKQAVNDVLLSAILGGILATIVLFVFLRDLRSTTTIGFSIPISIMATFAVMYQTGITLNLMSLGGVALGVGMLVDNSIVVLESVHRHRSKAAGLAEAVFRGTREVSTAVTASTLTTVAVFLPLVFVEGIAGQLFKDQALTITYSLLASLLVALTVIPMILALGFRKEDDPDEQESAPAVAEDENAPPAHTVVRRFRVARGTARRVRAFVFGELVTVLVMDLRRAIRWLGRMAMRLIGPPLGAFERGFNALSGAYPALLNWSLNNKLTVFLLAGVLIISAAVASGNLGAELIPPLTQGEFAFEIRLPKGKALAQTDRLMKDIEREAAEIEGVRLVYSSVGGSNKNQFAQNTYEENVAQLYVVMRNRSDDAAELRAIEQLRSRLREYPEVSFTFSRPTLFSFKTPVEVEIYGYDLDDLRTAADLVASRLERIRGLSDLTTSTELGNPEIQIRFDRARLARLGLDEAQVANVLRNKIRGDVASRYREEDKQIEILVRADEADRSTLREIGNLAINVDSSGRPIQPAGRGQQGQEERQQPVRTPAPQPTEATPDAPPSPMIPIRLASVADIVVDRGPAEIRRIRSQRGAVVSANLSGRDLTGVSNEIRTELDALRPQLPPNLTVGLGGQNEEMNNSYRSLILALGLAVFLVYLVMASQFESLIHPFIILFSVPLAVVGVVLALFATGTTVNVMVFLGVIILAGIVVNNAILLVDYTNQLRVDGLNRRDALMRAGQVRLRPILMTTLTTVLGLIPMALGWGEGAEIRTPMAITVIGGLSFSTLLTLVFIPVMYEVIDRRRHASEIVAQRRDDKGSDRSGALAGESWTA
ncbi:MAG: efflux RND transporter permease subunit [Bryobacteraceae bacterium]